MTRWQKLTEVLQARGHEATESERRLRQDSLETALETVLGEGQALIASLATADGEGRAEHVSRLSDDDLRSVAYAAGSSVR